jgi:uncharacterized membrane protein YgcG
VAHVQAAAAIAVIAKQIHTPDAPAHVVDAANTLSKVAQHLAAVAVRHAEENAPLTTLHEKDNKEGD